MRKVRKLRKKNLNTKIDIDSKAYHKQDNCIASLLRKEKNNFYINLVTKVVNDNRVFLFEKVTKNSKINLIEDNEIISRDEQAAKKLSRYFINILSLYMPSNGYKCPDSSEQDPILKLLDKYRDHSSIKLIKAKSNSQVFKFSQIDIEKVKKSFQSLDPKKAAPTGYYNQSTKEKCTLYFKVHM